jgi:hypothetical protein
VPRQAVRGRLGRDVCLGVRSQPEENFRPLGERLGGEFAIGVIGEVLADECIDGLPVLTGVHFHTFAPALEVFHGGQRLGFESVESQLQAFDVIVTATGISGPAQDALFEHRIGALKV